TEVKLYLNKDAKGFIFLNTLMDECPNLECHKDELVLLCRMVGGIGKLESVGEMK
ncbi:hypothetical protein Tco_1225219, partial [Tanacetum coccineum]